MATKIFITEDAGYQQRLIEAKSQRAVEKFLTNEILSRHYSFLINRASVHQVAELVAKGVSVEQAFEPEENIPSVADVRGILKE